MVTFTGTAGSLTELAPFHGQPVFVVVRGREYVKQAFGTVKSMNFSDAADGFARIGIISFTNGEVSWEAGQEVTVDHIANLDAVDTSPIPEVDIEIPDTLYSHYDGRWFNVTMSTDSTGGRYPGRDGLAEVFSEYIGREVHMSDFERGEDTDFLKRTWIAWHKKPQPAE
ncbi:hypothetical protein [Leifsonia sp. Leaf264]|uniref:hypothetical protein n=1 Tax=Leifsonia sp. Leaf264 TaxID=1736314 RepID=UPI0007022F99|nr:hypothetical protein [Leifsonia sp. Leaf264]KQO98509.1 hypothetical protein ASF30_10630 [Leifsonia sp. Leaf264]